MNKKLISINGDVFTFSEMIENRVPKLKMLKENSR